MGMQKETVGVFIDACENDHVEARRLLSKHPELRSATWLGDEHVLNFMAIEGHVAALKFCLENGFDANQPDGQFGATPLHYVCKLNYVEAAKVLLQFGANPNAVSEIDDTPLHCCISSGSADMMDLLIVGGADPYYETALGETIFDNWPNKADKQARIAAVLKKHNISPERGIDS